MPAKPKPNPWAKFDAIVPVYGPRLMRDMACGDIHAAAVLGNGGYESAGFTMMQEANPVGGGRGGLGPWQWTADRRVAYERFLKAHGQTAHDFETAYLFLLTELRGSEAHAIRNTKRTTKLEAAVETFAVLFERPGVMALAKRITWSDRALPLIRFANASAEAHWKPDDPPPLLPTKLPEPKIVPPEAVPEGGDGAWSKGMANMRKVFGPAPRRAA